MSQQLPPSLLDDAPKPESAHPFNAEDVSVDALQRGQLPTPPGVRPKLGG